MPVRPLGLLLPVLLVLLACAGPPPAAAPRPQALVVASFDFPESVLLAEVYAQALEAAGVPVRRELRLGPRELVLPALRQGLVDVVPEYLGSALAAVSDGPVAATSTVTARRQLAAALAPDGLRVLAPSSAQDQNGLAVTRTTAERLGLRATSDLRGVAGRLALAGPPECPERPYCLLGLQRAYGLSFARFAAYVRESQRVTALEQGVVDVAVVFTTDGLLADADLVLLTDDRRLQPVENVTPVVSRAAVERYGERVVAALEGVSRALTSSALVVLSWRVEVAGQDVAAEARGWLLRRGLVAR